MKLISAVYLSFDENDLRAKFWPPKIMPLTIYGRSGACDLINIQYDLNTSPVINISVYRE